ncbi:hypothetical protein [Christiangramia sp. OXR-203]|uniref:hypothetical protein n=1 Tax=Christiangramia sp. OXR-203 TaxID=3100176 RepID=UPI00039E6DD5|nr:hypothetical protein [Christiangramia sp. OXR-203]WPY98841.1 hypothetical protein T8I65_01185 [Christiangramia sp. OXR-203]
MQKVKTVLATESYTEFDDLAWVGSGGPIAVAEGKARCVIVMTILLYSRRSQRF